MNMGEKIKNLRLQKNMTLEDVATKVGVSKSTVRKWEEGIIANMKRDKISKLAEALNVSAGYLMGWEDNLTSENADWISDVLSDENLMNNIKKLMKLKKENQQTIFDNIDYWYNRENSKH